MKNAFKNPAHAGLYYLPAEQQTQLRERLDQAHLSLLTVELGKHDQLAGILEEFGRALHFPAWYGANLDALHDCLSDTEWREQRGIALCINGLDTLRHRHPQPFTNLLEVLDSACRTGSTPKHPLWILLDSPAPGLASLPAA